jgi:hypothetical protein
MELDHILTIGIIIVQDGSIIIGNRREYHLGSRLGQGNSKREKSE